MLLETMKRIYEFANPQNASVTDSPVTSWLVFTHS